MTHLGDNSNNSVHLAVVPTRSIGRSMPGSPPKLPVAQPVELPSEESADGLPDPRSDNPADSAPPSTARPRSYPPVRPSSPPPPRTWPPRPSSPPPRSSPPAAHESLYGGTGAGVAFRPARLTAAQLTADLTCSFQCEGEAVGLQGIIDLSTVGFSATLPEGLSLAPGSVLESFELLLGGRPIWSGEAVVVHANAERFGARFTSGLVDLPHLRLGATLEGRIAFRREQAERLPATWRAAVADVRQLLEDARFEVEEFERAEEHDPLRRREEEAQLFEALRARWGASYYEAVAQLHEMSKGFDERTALLGRSYASSMLMPLLSACPLQKRAYEKPLGYAGDYRMMELCFAEEPAGDTLFGRFLFSVAQQLSLTRATVGRETVLRAAVHRAVEERGAGPEPVRILAVAAGPAMELRRWLEGTQSLARPVQLILLDQDRAAHEAAHRQLTRTLLERHHGMLPVTVRCLHFSVRQLVSPHTAEEQAVVSETLADLDLIYSSGLYDYLPDPVAERLTVRLDSLLRKEGGRMLLGNMVEAPDATWLMDYAVDWPILYRTAKDMLRFGEVLSPRPPRVAVTEDPTGGCIFLDIERRSDSATA